MDNFTQKKNTIQEADWCFLHHVQHGKKMLYAAVRHKQVPDSMVEG